VKDEELEEEVEQQASPEEAQQAAVQAVQKMTVSHGPAADLPSRPILGVDQDLSGAALVRKVTCSNDSNDDRNNNSHVINNSMSNDINNIMLNMIAMIGTSDRPCWLAESCKILLLLLLSDDND